MSHCTYHNPAGFSQELSDGFGYSQAVSVGPNLVKLSGQGGFAADGSINASNYEAQVRNAFKNVERVLTSAGVKNGWDAVFAVRSYHVSLSRTAEIFTKVFKEYAPHRPVWTCVTVPELALPEMVIEVEVEAWRGGKPTAHL
ncbi:hypothetical protein JCM8547_001661 [Rhodosporidiobolus lusitaniae]